MTIVNMIAGGAKNPELAIPKKQGYYTITDSSLGSTGGPGYAPTQYAGDNRVLVYFQSNGGVTYSIDGTTKTYPLSSSASNFLYYMYYDEVNNHLSIETNKGMATIDVATNTQITPYEGKLASFDNETYLYLGPKSGSYYTLYIHDSEGERKILDEFSYNNPSTENGSYHCGSNAVLLANYYTSTKYYIVGRTGNIISIPGVDNIGFDANDNLIVIDSSGRVFKNTNVIGTITNYTKMNGVILPYNDMIAVIGGDTIRIISGDNFKEYSIPSVLSYSYFGSPAKSTGIIAAKAKNDVNDKFYWYNLTFNTSVSGLYNNGNGFYLTKKS